METEAATIEQDYDDSVMVCLNPPKALCEIYAGMKVSTESADDMHITLWYGGSMEDVGGELGKERLYRACYALALAWQDEPRLQGKINGFGWFLNPGSHVLISMWDIPYINTLRADLFHHLKDHGVPMRIEDHGFSPHMTLSYQDQTDYTIPEIPKGGGEVIDFGSIWLVWGSEWTEIKLQ